MSRRFKRNFTLVVIAVFALLIIVYLAVTFYFKDHFYSGTIINDIDCSGRTVEEVEQILAEETTDYTLTIFDAAGNKEHILGSEIDLVYVSDGSAARLMKKQNHYLWFLDAFRNSDHTATVKTSYNAEKLKTKVANLELFHTANVEEPKNAYVERVEDKYVIVREELGNKADKDKVYALIKEAIETGQAALNLVEHDDVFEKPAITSDNPELIRQAESLNDFLSFTITYDFKDRTEELTGEAMQDWITLDDNFEISVDRDAVTEYVQHLASNYNTFGNGRTITSTTTGSPVTVTGGSYGWVINKEQETDALIKIIRQGESVTREPVYEQTGLYREENDTGNTYVEIDITEQRLYYYIDGNLDLTADIISGRKDQWDTQEGTWPVMWKDRDCPLVGETWNRNVKYFIPFYEDVGLHDAPWQSSFGGSTYIYSGSHGCINMKEADVAHIYETISTGIPVFVYTR